MTVSELAREPLKQPEDLAEALVQMFHAQYEYERAQLQKLAADRKALAQKNACARAKQPAIAALIKGGMTKTDAEKRYSEEPEYSVLAAHLQDLEERARVSDTELAIARNRLSTARAAVEALSRPLTPHAETIT